MNTQTKFTPAPQYTNILSTPEDVLPWAQSLKDMPLPEKVASMRSTFFQPEFDVFWQQDPTSPNYLKGLRSFYKKTFGQTLTLNTPTSASAPSGIAESYPFNTGSNRLISEMLMGVSTVLANLPISPPAKVLEMGCEWGNVGLTLARAGYDMTFLDVHANYKKSILHWAKKFGAPKARFVKSPLEDAAESAAADNTYDAIVFYRSFQKSLKPKEVFAACHKLLRPGGTLLLVGEPFHGNFYVPWGLRSDGTSLVSMVNTGKVELGYDIKFIDDLADTCDFDQVARKRVPGNANLGFDLFVRR